MKSEWKIASNNINGQTMYIAYRLRNANEPDHSGNREYIEGRGYTADCAWVEKLVAELNAEL